MPWRVPHRRQFSKLPDWLLVCGQVPLHIPRSLVWHSSKTIHRNWYSSGRSWRNNSSLLSKRKIHSISISNEKPQNNSARIYSPQSIVHCSVPLSLHLIHLWRHLNSLPLGCKHSPTNGCSYHQLDYGPVPHYRIYSWLSTALLFHFYRDQGHHLNVTVNLNRNYFRYFNRMSICVITLLPSVFAKQIFGEIHNSWENRTQSLLLFIWCVLFALRVYDNVRLS